MFHLSLDHAHLKRFSITIWKLRLSQMTKSIGIQNCGKLTLVNWICCRTKVALQRLHSSLTFGGCHLLVYLRSYSMLGVNLLVANWLKHAFVQLWRVALVLIWHYFHFNCFFLFILCLFSQFVSCQVFARFGAACGFSLVGVESFVKRRGCTSLSLTAVPLVLLKF